MSLQKDDMNPQADASGPTVPATPEPAGTTADGPREYVRRVPRAAGKFVGKIGTPESEEQLVSRAILGTRSMKKSQLSRNHVVAGDLPNWEPLPPGEMSVIRRP